MGKAMKTTQAWGWFTVGVLALGLNGVYQDGGAAWARRVLKGTIGRFAARSEAVLALATGRVDRFAEATSAPKLEMASCRLASALSRIQSRIRRAQVESQNFEVLTASQAAAMALMEPQQESMEAQVARSRLAPVVFNANQMRDAACPRVRVNIPHINISKLPMELSAPMVHLGMPDSGPI
jgi:hypothetical protein